MLKVMLACMLLVALIVPVMAESKGKGNAACESLKSRTLCVDKKGCDWTVNPGGQGKCRTLKAEPR